MANKERGFDKVEVLDKALELLKMRVPYIKHEVRKGQQVPIGSFEVAPLGVEQIDRVANMAFNAFMDLSEDYRKELIERAKAEMAKRAKEQEEFEKSKKADIEVSKEPLKVVK
jgi:hypothetical protein